MGQHTSNEKRDPYASTPVKFGREKGQDEEVGLQVKGEDLGPEGHHSFRGA